MSMNRNEERSLTGAAPAPVNSRHAGPGPVSVKFKGGLGAAGSVAAQARGGLEDPAVICLHSSSPRPIYPLPLPERPRTILSQASYSAWSRRVAGYAIRVQWPRSNIEYIEWQIIGAGGW